MDKINEEKNKTEMKTHLQGIADILSLKGFENKFDITESTLYDIIKNRSAGKKYAEKIQIGLSELKFEGMDLTDIENYLIKYRQCFNILGIERKAGIPEKSLSTLVRVPGFTYFKKTHIEKVCEILRSV